MAISKTAELMKIEPIAHKKIKMRIIGDSPLICHNWDIKSQREILETQLGIKKMAKVKKNPYQDFASSLYWLEPMPETFTKETLDEVMAKEPRFGFPLTGIKQAAISAAFHLKWSKDKRSLQGSFFIEPDADGYYSGDLQLSADEKQIDIIPNVLHPEPMVEIHYDTVTMRRDMVKVGMGSADIRYRAQLENWYADLTIDFNENGGKTSDQIISLINAGGYVEGIGEWRPEHTGQYGMFHVEPVQA